MADDDRRPNRRLPFLLAALLTGQFMAILDGTIVNVATPTIRVDLHTSGAELQLVVAGYTIAYAVLLISGARLGALIGFREVFLIGVALFTGASFACGVAPSSQLLIAFRVVQGAGAALMVPQVFSLIQLTFDGPARTRALSLYGAVIALGALVGQVLGGVLVTADLFGAGWRPVFLVNVPIGLALLVASARVLPRRNNASGRGLDLAGLTILAAAVLLLVIPLVLGHEEGWPAWTAVSLAASVVMVAVFVAVERAVAARGGSPLVTVRLLRAPGMIPAAAALLLGMAAYGGFLFAFAQHLQAGLGEAALQAGLTFAPAAVGFAISSLNWRRIPAAWHRPMIPASFALAAVGYASTAFVLRDGTGGGLGLMIALAITGFGMGAAFSPVIGVALATVAPADASDASGVLTTVIQLGQVVGVATFGSVFLSLTTRAPAGTQLVTAPALGTTLSLVTVTMALCVMTALPLLRRLRPRDEIAPPARPAGSVAAAAPHGRAPSPGNAPRAIGATPAWTARATRQAERARGIEYFLAADEADPRTTG